MNTSIPCGPELLTREEAASYIKIGVHSLAQWAVSGRYNLPMIKVGGSVRYRRTDLDAWLDERTTTCSS